MADCIFCGILKGEVDSAIVYRDERCVAFMDAHPINPGHMLVVPLSHAPYLDDLDEESIGHLLVVGQRMAVVLRKSGLRCEGVNFFVADGTAAMHEVLHAHLHVFPRFAGDGFALRFKPTEQPPASHEALEQVAEQLRKTFANTWRHSEAE